MLLSIVRVVLSTFIDDAPSLKKADCGIAVEGASDAARTAADVVFLDEGLSTIITSIKVARQIFHRMKAYIVYRIALCIHLELYLVRSVYSRVNGTWPNTVSVSLNADPERDHPSGPHRFPRHLR